MKKISAILLLAIMAGIAAITTQCNKGGGGGGGEKFSDTIIIAKNLPTNIVPGFKFPEDSTKIYSWVKGAPMDTMSMFKHAWGIWAGLTAPAHETFETQPLLIYQTWMGLSEIQTLIKNNVMDEKAMNTKTSRVALSIPTQLKHAKDSAKLHNIKVFDDTSELQWVSVAYNPPAVAHVVSKSLFKASVINSYAKPNGIGGLPPFPTNAMTIKPSYMVGHKGDSLIRIPAWRGPFASTGGDSLVLWNSYVYADVHNKQAAGKKLVPVTTAKPTRAQIAAATCNLKDFINFKLDTALAAYLNQQQSVQGVAAQTGDIALLIAMHVTTKEIHNWTWQTFYWAPNPDVPLQPSSLVAAGLRPSQLVGAASHYAMAAGYAEVTPNQPINGGKNTGVKPIFVYNPYLESPFGPTIFAGIKNKLNDKFKFGIQTNCMSCHSLATSGKNTPYTADQYIDMQDEKLFKNKVQYDFAWSIQTAFIDDTKKK